MSEMRRLLDLCECRAEPLVRQVGAPPRRMVLISQLQKITEKAPPGKKAERFIKKQKADFKKRYGEDWEQVLYATAWKQFGKKKKKS